MQTTMERHALAILKAAESWNWPDTYRIQASGEKSSRFKAVMPKLLSGFIAESQALGGTLLDQFWVVVGKYHPQLEENVKILRETEYSSLPPSEEVLFEGIDRETINFSPIFQMGTELFTHLCVAFMNPGGPKSAIGTPFSVSDTITEGTDELLKMAASEGLWTRKQIILTALILRRDGDSCSLTGLSFNDLGVKPNLANIIPNSVHNKVNATILTWHSLIILLA